MTSTRLRWWVDAETPRFLSYGCLSIASSLLSHKTWALHRVAQPTPEEAVRWLIDRLGQHEANAEDEAARVAAWWLDNPQAQQAAVHRLYQGEPLFLRLATPEVHYDLRIRPKFQQLDVRAPYIMRRVERDS